MAIAAGNYQIKVYCQQNDQIGINVRYYTVDSSSGGGLTEQQMVDALSAKYGPMYKTYLPSAARYLGATIQRAAVPMSEPLFVSTTGAGTGEIEADPIPLQAALLVSLYAAAAGRKGRGRMYLPFWSEAHNGVDGKPTIVATDIAVSIGLLFSQSQTLINGSASNVVAPQLWERTGNVFRPITRQAVAAKWATQRRRGNYGRQNPIPGGLSPI